MGMRRRVIRMVLTPLQKLRRGFWHLVGAPRHGVHAIAMTRRGTVVLVRLTYAAGWRLPGGGLGRGESPEEAMLRELREEIGLTAHGPVERLEDFSGSSGVAGDLSALFLVRDVKYRPRRTWEVDEVREFDLTELPQEIGGWTLRTISAAISKSSLA